jgi:hypothetical protein
MGKGMGSTEKQQRPRPQHLTPQPPLHPAFPRPLPQVNENALTTLPLLGEAPCLVLLDVASNQISEVQGSAIAGMVSLENFTCRKNRIVALPDEVFSLPRLAVLDAQQNEISTIPPSVQNAAHTLVSLLLNKNKISTVPRELANLAKIQRLGLETNPIDFKDTALKEVLWDVRDRCIANGGWLRTSGTMLGARPKPTPPPEAAPASEEVQQEQSEGTAPDSVPGQVSEATEATESTA